MDTCSCQDNEWFCWNTGINFDTLLICPTCAPPPLPCPVEALTSAMVNETCSVDGQYCPGPMGECWIYENGQCTNIIEEFPGSDCTCANGAWECFDAFALVDLGCLVDCNVCDEPLTKTENATCDTVGQLCTSPAKQCPLWIGEDCVLEDATVDCRCNGDVWNCNTDCLPCEPQTLPCDFEMTVDAGWNLLEELPPCGEQARTCEAEVILPFAWPTTACSCVEGAWDCGLDTLQEWMTTPCQDVDLTLKCSQQTCWQT